MPDYTPIRAATISDLMMMIDRDDMADFQPPKKQKVDEKENEHVSERSVKVRGKASLSLKKGKGKMEAKDRFGDTSCEELTNLSKGYVPQNTEKNTQWAMRVFEQWQEARCVQGNPVHDKLLQAPYDIGAFSHWLSLFVREVRLKADGSLYPPKSNYQLLCGILHYMKQQDPFAPNFLERKDGRFCELHGTCEYVFRQLGEKGVGANPNKTASISKEEENTLWDKNILGTSNPLMLQRAVFFFCEESVLLTGRRRTASMKPSQLVRKSNPNRYIYEETGSKNRTGGLKQLNIENKVVPVYASPADGERCLVSLLDLYLKKITAKCI